MFLAAVIEFEYALGPMNALLYGSKVRGSLCREVRIGAPGIVDHIVHLGFAGGLVVRLG